MSAFQNDAFQNDAFQTTAGALSYSLTCDAGSFSLTGQDATLNLARRLICDAGSYFLTGQDATLNYASGRFDYSLTCDAGAYTLTGQDANLVYSGQTGLPQQIYNLPGYRRVKRTEQELEDFYRSIGALPEIQTVTSVVSENSTQYAPIEEKKDFDSTKRYIEAFEAILDRIAKDNAIARYELAKQEKERIQREIEETDIAYVASILAMSD